MHIYILVVCVVVMNTTVDEDSVTIVFRGTGPFTCQLDDRSPIPCSSPITYSTSGLHAGLHTVTFTGANKTCTVVTNFTVPCELLTVCITST